MAKARAAAAKKSAAKSVTKPAPRAKTPKVAKTTKQPKSKLVLADALFQCCFLPSGAHYVIEVGC